MPKPNTNNPDLTRYTLLERIRDPADDAVWTEFADLYWDLATGWARGFGCSPTLAEDVFQEAMTSLLRQLPNLKIRRGAGRFRSLLKTIVQRRAYDAFRREMKGSAAPVPLQDFDGPDENEAGASLDDQVWVQGLLSEALRRCYDRVDSTTYKAFCAYVLDGRPVADVAKELNVRAGTLYQQKSRFLDILQREFSELARAAGDSVLAEALFKVDSKVMQRSLEACIVDRSDLRMTARHDILPKPLTDRLEYVRQQLRRAGDASAGDALLAIGVSDSSWFALVNTIEIGARVEAGLMIPARGVSGVHCKVTKSVDGWILEDRQSTNGTWLNGRKIVGPATLKSGDVVQLGDATVIVLLDGAA